MLKNRTIKSKILDMVEEDLNSLNEIKDVSASIREFNKIKNLKKGIEELTLLLLYLTHWEEKGPAELGKIRRSWKGYPFEALDALAEEGLINQSPTAKSVYLTEEGAKKAEVLKRKFKII